MEERKQNSHTAASLRIAEKPNKERRGRRIDVFKETKRIANAGSYQKEDGSTAMLPRNAIDRSQQVASADEVPEPTLTYEDCKVLTSTVRIPSLTSLPPHHRSNPIPVPTVFYPLSFVYEGDCVDAARHYSRSGLSVAVLNMASDKKPGGGVQNGSGAQEENLFRRSNYFQHLYNREVAHYPISATGGIYTPGVVFFREAEAEDYRLMDQPISLDMVAVPAMRRPRLVNNGSDLWISDLDLSLVHSKMQTMLKLAASHSHEVVVLSAWGCGAFCNPPLCIATLFREMIEGEFRGRFKRVVFAIFDDQNARKQHNPRGNVEPFESVFGTRTVRNIEELV